MLNKNQIKFIKSLQLKKYRKESGFFVVEGYKSILEVINSDFQIEQIYVTREMYQKFKKELDKNKVEIISKSDLEKISNFQSSDSGLAIVKQKENKILEIKEDKIVLALDDINDPGNLGTIIRLADWYGIKKIICSKETAEFYNNKVINASMGSFTRIEIYYTDLVEFFAKQKIPLLGAFMQGENVHTFKFPKSGILLMGNEAGGINKNLEKFITEKISIPSFSKTESLNVAMATGIILDNWKRSLN